MDYKENEFDELASTIVSSDKENLDLSEEENEKFEEALEKFHNEYCAKYGEGIEQNEVYELAACITSI